MKPHPLLSATASWLAVTLPSLQAAVRSFLDRMSDALNPAFGGRMGKAVRAVFCDSIELSGANWTNDLAVEFRRRRGYCRLRTTFRMRWTDWFSGKSLLIRQFKVNLFRTVVPNLVTPRLRFAGKFFADVASVDFTAGLSTKGPAAGVSLAR